MTATYILSIFERYICSLEWNATSANTNAEHPSDFQHQLTIVKLFRCQYPDVARLSNVTDESVSKAVHDINGPFGMLVIMEERPNQRDVFPNV